MRSAQGDWINRTEHLCIGIPDNSGQSPPIYIVLQHPFPQETEILYNSPASPCLLRRYIWTSFWIFLWCCLLQQQKYIAFLLLVFAHRVITSENASSKNFSSWLQNLTLCSVSCRSPEKTADKLSLKITMFHLGPIGKFWFHHKGIRSTLVRGTPFVDWTHSFAAGQPNPCIEHKCLYSFISLSALYRQCALFFTILHLTVNIKRNSCNSWLEKISFIRNTIFNLEKKISAIQHCVLLVRDYSNAKYIAI